MPHQGGYGSTGHRSIRLSPHTHNTVMPLCQRELQLGVHSTLLPHHSDPDMGGCLLPPFTQSYIQACAIGILEVNKWITIKIIWQMYQSLCLQHHADTHKLSIWGVYSYRGWLYLDPRIYLFIYPLVVPVHAQPVTLTTDLQLRMLESHILCFALTCQATTFILLGVLTQPNNGGIFLYLYFFHLVLLVDVWIRPILSQSF